MANFLVVDGAGVNVTFKSTNTSSVETSHHNSQLMVTNAHVTNTNPIPVSLCMANAIISGANPLDVRIANQVAHDTAVAGSPLRVGARAVNANYTAVANNDTADLVTTLTGALVTQPYAPLGAQIWNYTAAAGGIVDTANAELAANAGTGFKNYIVAMQIENTHATVNTEIVLKSAGTVVWRSFLRANNSQPAQITFPIPVATAAAEPLNFACITTGANVYVSAQGFKAP